VPGQPFAPGEICAALRRWLPEPAGAAPGSVNALPGGAA
jgi:hypothetical protein